MAEEEEEVDDIDKVAEDEETEANDIDEDVVEEVVNISVMDKLYW